MELEIALSTILLIALIIFPGVVFKRFFYQGAFNKQFSSDLFADRLISSAFWGLLIQGITMLFFQMTVSQSFSTSTQKFITLYSDFSQNKISEIKVDYIYNFILYLLISLSASVFLGTLLYNIIRLFKLDLKYKVLRFNNDWHYLFKAEIRKTKDFKHMPKGELIHTKVDVITKNTSSEGKNTLYSGVLTEYKINKKTGDLEFLYLTDYERFSNSSSSFKPINGECFVIPFCNVENINLRYYFNESKSTWRKETWSLILGALYILIFMSNFLLPWTWNLEVSGFRIIFGSIISLFTLFLFFVFLRYFSNAKDKLPNYEKPLIKILHVVIHFLILLLFLWLVLRLYGLSFYEVKDRLIDLLAIIRVYDL